MARSGSPTTPTDIAWDTLGTFAPPPTDIINSKVAKRFARCFCGNVGMSCDLIFQWPATVVGRASEEVIPRLLRESRRQTAADSPRRSSLRVFIQIAQPSISLNNWTQKPRFRPHTAPVTVQTSHSVCATCHAFCGVKSEKNRRDSLFFSFFHLTSWNLVRPPSRANLGRSEVDV